MLFVAQSNGGIAGVEASTDAPARTSEATDDENSSSRRQKHGKNRADLPPLTPFSYAGIPVSPHRLNNPYTLYSMLRKKVSI